MTDPVYDVDNAVREYDDKCKVLVVNIQTEINKLKDTTWKAGLLYLEDLNNLLLDFSKVLENVRMVRSTQQPKNWIATNPIFEYKKRYEILAELIRKGEYPQKSFWDNIMESISINMIIVLFIILCIVWIYVRSDQENPHKISYNSQTSLNVKN